MTRTELAGKTCKELRELAKQYNISGRWDMTKEQLIDAILGAMNVEDNEETNVSAKDEEKIEADQCVDVVVKDEKKAADTEIDMKQKMPYIENAEIGTLVAFRLSSGKVKSAKITKKSTKNRKLKLETEYGAEYIVSFDDIIWVRTGARWPRGVYTMLKGTVENGKEQKVEAK